MGVSLNYSDCPLPIRDYFCSGQYETEESLVSLAPCPLPTFAYLDMFKNKGLEDNHVELIMKRCKLTVPPKIVQEESLLPQNSCSTPCIVPIFVSLSLLLVILILMVSRRLIKKKMKKSTRFSLQMQGPYAEKVNGTKQETTCTSTNHVHEKTALAEFVNTAYQKDQHMNYTADELMDEYNPANNLQLHVYNHNSNLRTQL